MVLLRSTIKIFLGVMVFALAAIGLVVVTSPDLIQHNNSFVDKVENSFTEKNFATVTRVVDGDTFIVSEWKGQKNVRVRLIGIDTPESVNPDESKNTEEGRIASSYTKTLLTDKKVKLVTDVQEFDKYNRLLAYVYLENNKSVNLDLLAKGFARTMTVPPNVKMVDTFVKAEKKARQNKVGFWKENKKEKKWLIKN